MVFKSLKVHNHIYCIFSRENACYKSSTDSACKGNAPYASFNPMSMIMKWQHVLFSPLNFSSTVPYTVTYGRWKIHRSVVKTNLQRRWENMSLASNLPITLTDGAVMGPYCCMHISSNQISCLKKEEWESGSSCGNNDITAVLMVAQPNQALCVFKEIPSFKWDRSLSWSRYI